MRAAALAVSYMAGAVPFSNLFAVRVAGVDLRRVGTGTVSGTSLYRVSGFKTLAVAGSLDVAKGAVAVGLVRWLSRPTEEEAAVRIPPASELRRPVGLRQPRVAEALSAGLVVAGHNWSPYLDGEGGRGLSPALGAFAVIAPEGAVMLLTGLVVGRLAKETGLGTFVSQAALIPGLALTRGRRGALAGAAVVAPMLAKRLAGNGAGPAVDRGVLLCRALFDRDTWTA